MSIPQKIISLALDKGRDRGYAWLQEYRISGSVPKCEMQQDRRDLTIIARSLYPLGLGKAITQKEHLKTYLAAHTEVIEVGQTGIPWSRLEKLLNGTEKEKEWLLKPDLGTFPIDMVHLALVNTIEASYAGIPKPCKRATQKSPFFEEARKTQRVIDLYEQAKELNH